MDRGGPQGLEEKKEFFWIGSCLPKDGPECSGVELGMIGNHDLCKGIAAAKDDVTTVLPFKFKS
jgi:hypothetical protein